MWTFREWVVSHQDFSTFSYFDTSAGPPRGLVLEPFVPREARVTCSMFIYSVAYNKPVYLLTTPITLHILGLERFPAYICKISRSEDPLVIILAINSDDAKGVFRGPKKESFQALHSPFPLILHQIIVPFSWHSPCPYHQRRPPIQPPPQTILKSPLVIKMYLRIVLDVKI